MTELSAPSATWDWSKLEVRRTEPLGGGRRGELAVDYGVFAVSQEEEEEEVSRDGMEMMILYTG